MCTLSFQPCYRASCRAKLNMCFQVSLVQYFSAGLAKIFFPNCSQFTPNRSQAFVQSTDLLTCFPAVLCISAPCIQVHLSDDPGFFRVLLSSRDQELTRNKICDTSARELTVAPSCTFVFC